MSGGSRPARAPIVLKLREGETQEEYEDRLGDRIEGYCGVIAAAEKTLEERSTDEDAVCCFCASPPAGCAPETLDGSNPCPGVLLAPACGEEAIGDGDVCAS